MWPSVAPLVGAWIEIPLGAGGYQCTFVAPLVGAWIEIFVYFGSPQAISPVAPLVGAWIEIAHASSSKNFAASRSPCGSVD